MANSKAGTAPLAVGRQVSTHRPSVPRLSYQEATPSSQPHRRHSALSCQYRQEVTSAPWGAVAAKRAAIWGRNRCAYVSRVMLPGHAHDMEHPSDKLRG
jgi:hypothetical protein